MADNSDLRVFKIAETENRKPISSRFASTHSSIPGNTYSNSTKSTNDNQFDSKSLQQHKLILKELRNEMTQQIKNYAQTLIDYEITISRNDYEKLLMKFKKLENEFEKINSKKKELQRSLDKLIEINTHVKAQHQKLVEQKHILNNSSTPRPDWNRCVKVIDGGYERWNKIANGKSSDELVDLLLFELSGVSNGLVKRKPGFKIKSNYFEVFDEETRSNKSVYNRCLSRRELGLAIKELWSAKISNDLENRLKASKRVKMNEFCISYLKQKYKSSDIAYEWYFNIKEACIRFTEYEDAKFFLQVLNNEIDEEIYHSFFELVGKLILKLNSIDSNDFEKTLRDVFPKKNDFKIDELMEAARKKNIEKGWKHLFVQTDDGKLGNFLKTLKIQNENERVEFINKVILKLDHLEHISISDFIHSVKELDANVTDAQLNSYCEWIFNQTNASEMKHQQYFIHKNDFLRKFQNANIYQN